MAEYIPLPGFEPPHPIDQVLPSAPADWVVVPGSLEAAKGAMAKLSADFGNETWLKSSTIEPAGGSYKVVLVVETEEARSLVPTEVNGINVETRRARGEEPTVGSVAGEVAQFAKRHRSSLSGLGVGAAALAVGYVIAGRQK